MTNVTSLGSTKSKPGHAGQPQLSARAGLCIVRGTPIKRVLPTIKYSGTHVSTKPPKTAGGATVTNKGKATQPVATKAAGSTPVKGNGVFGLSVTNIILLLLLGALLLHWKGKL